MDLIAQHIITFRIVTGYDRTKLGGITLVMKNVAQQGHQIVGRKFAIRSLYHGALFHSTIFKTRNTVITIFFVAHSMSVAQVEGRTMTIEVLTVCPAPWIRKPLQSWPPAFPLKSRQKMELCFFTEEIDHNHVYSQCDEQLWHHLWSV